MKLEIERESQILQKLKTKMDRIKATQQRILEEHDTKTHAAGNFLFYCQTFKLVKLSDKTRLCENFVKRFSFLNFGKLWKFKLFQLNYIYDLPMFEKV